MTIFFIGASGNYFLGVVFVLPIGNSTRCREDFRPQAETRGKQAKWRGAAEAHKGERKARVGRGPKL